MMAVSACEYVTGGHHSKDTVAVYCGRVVPVRLCGYHAQAVWLPTVFDSIKGA